MRAKFELRNKTFTVLAISNSIMILHQNRSCGTNKNRAQSSALFAKLISMNERQFLAQFIVYRQFHNRHGVHNIFVNRSYITIQCKDLFYDRGFAVFAGKCFAANVVSLRTLRFSYARYIINNIILITHADE